MFDQDDRRNREPYTGPTVLKTLTWAPRTTAAVAQESSDSACDLSIPMPLQASSLSPMDFNFGTLSGPLEISEIEPSAARLEKVAINFVKMSQFFGFGRWIEVSTKEYSKFCAPRIVTASERSLFIDLVLRRCLIAHGDKYAIGPHMAFFLSKHVTPQSSVAA
jgi:hypothetical protein